MTVPALTGYRVLVLEDEGLVAMHIENLLQEFGCTVVGPASTVEAALSLLSREAVDAALLDVNLGEGNTSHRVADELISLGIPFAFLTGYGHAGLHDELEHRPVISKPVDERILAETLRALVRSNRGS